MEMLQGVLQRLDEKQVHFPGLHIPRLPSLSHPSNPSFKHFPQGVLRAGPALSGQESTTAHLHSLPTPPLPVSLFPPLAPGSVPEWLATGGVWRVLPPERVLVPGKVRNQGRMEERRTWYLHADHMAS